MRYLWLLLLACSLQAGPTPTPTPTGERLTAKTVAIGLDVYVYGKGRNIVCEGGSKYSAPVNLSGIVTALALPLLAEVDFGACKAWVPIQMLGAVK